MSPPFSLRRSQVRRRRQLSLPPPKLLSHTGSWCVSEQTCPQALSDTGRRGPREFSCSVQLAPRKIQAFLETRQYLYESRQRLLKWREKNLFNSPREMTTNRGPRCHCEQWHGVKKPHNCLHWATIQVQITEHKLYNVQTPLIKKKNKQKKENEEASMNIYTDFALFIALPVRLLRSFQVWGNVVW